MAHALAALSLLLPMAAAGSDSARIARNATNLTSRGHLRGHQLEADLPLKIPARRQWDCNLAGISCCSAPPDEDGPMWDSCLGSPSPWTAAEALGKSDCQCGENQCRLMGLCPSRNQQPDHGAGGSCASDSNAEANLGADPPIPDCTGYCGETSTQEALLYWGTYISQGQVRRLNYLGFLQTSPPASWRQERQLRIDVAGMKEESDTFYDANDMEQAMRSLGFEVFSWYYHGSGGCGTASTCQCNRDGEGTFDDFHAWVKCNLQHGLPVVIGAVISGNSDDTYDHEVTVVGTQGNDLLVNNHYSNKRQVLEMKPVKDGRKCSNWMCPSKKGYGVAVPGPKLPTWAIAAARLTIVGCSGPQQLCNLTKRDGDGAYWREPNYRVRGISPVRFALSAEPIGELPADAVAVKKTWSASSKRGAAEAFMSKPSHPSVECFPTAGGKGAVSVGEVQSDAIVQVRFCKKSDMSKASCQ